MGAAGRPGLRRADRPGDQPGAAAAHAARRRDQYLPYAVALGVDTQLVDQFRRQAIPVVTPGWFLPWGWDTASLYPEQAAANGGSAPSFHLPDLSGIFGGDSSDANAPDS